MSQPHTDPRTARSTGQPGPNQPTPPPHIDPAVGSDHADAADTGSPGTGLAGQRRMSLRTRVTLLAAIGVGATVTLVSLCAYLTVRTSLYDQVAQNLLVRAQQVAAHQPRGNSVIIGPSDSAYTDIEADVIGADGQSLASQGSSLRARITPGEIDVAAGRADSSARADARTNSEVVAVPFIGLRPGTALVLAQPLNTVQTTLRALATVFFVVGGAGILVSAVAGTAVARAGLRPVQRLTEATERVARTGDLRPIQVSGDDELARLTHSFNSMLAAVAESQDRQRRLVADAGHELRTPLTSLRTNLELLVASEKPDAPSLPEQDRQEIYHDVRAQIAELSTLIGDLVELARDDSPQTTHEPVELVEVIQRAVERAARRAAGSGVAFDVQLQPWRLLGDANALERAALNLLDNGVKWSPSGGVVRVRLYPVGDGNAAFEVADAGPGIADADLPYVFERFYRSSEARTLPGSGLGLAIVKQAAERHGGSVAAGRAAEGGALMVMRLPGAQNC